MTALTSSRHPLLHALAAPFRRLGHALALFAQAEGRIAALERLTRESDERLAARGTTRAAEIRRLVGVRAHP